MRLNRTIQFIEFSNMALVIGLFVGVIIAVSKAQDGKFLVFELLFVIPFFIAFFFRKIIIHYYLRKGIYPGVFYSVLDKLGLTRNLDIALTDELLSEIYKPAYSTDQFLSDNQLKTEIGPKKTEWTYWVLLITIASLLFMFIQRDHIFKNNPSLYILPLLIIPACLYLWISQKRKQQENEPVVNFTRTNLEVPGARLNWKAIYDWAYQPGGKNRSSYIIIYSYNADRNILETLVNLAEVDTNKITFMLLLTHFKGKYGQE